VPATRFCAGLVSGFRAQNEVIRINREHRETGLFELKVMTWDAIEILLHEYPDVRELTYGPAPNESRPGFMRDYRKTELVVIRARNDLRFVRYVSQPIDPDTGLCSDHIGRLRGFYSRKAFPDKLHLMRFYDSAYRIVASVS